MFGTRTITSCKFRLVISGLVVPLIFNCITSCHNPQSGKRGQVSSGISDSTSMVGIPEEYQPVYTMLVLPGKPGPGEAFRILSAGGEDILNAHVTISGLPDPIKSVNNKTGEELPCWRIDDFNGVPAGKYKALLSVKNKYVSMEDSLRMGRRYGDNLFGLDKCLVLRMQRTVCLVCFE
jgi:hypothetical protein